MSSGKGGWDILAEQVVLANKSKSNNGVLYMNKLSEETKEMVKAAVIDNVSNFTYNDRTEDDEFDVGIYEELKKSEEFEDIVINEFIENLETEFDVKIQYTKNKYKS